MPLPTKRTDPLVRFEDYTKIIYGPPGIGKSTWCSQIENALFLGTDPGLKALSVYLEIIDDWDKAQAKYREIKVGGHFYTTVVIDDLGGLQRLALKKAAKDAGKPHPIDVKFREAYTKANDMVLDLVRAFAQLEGIGLVVTAHDRIEEMQGSTGPYDRKTIGVIDDKKRMAEINLIGFADMVLCCELKRIPKEGGDQGFDFKRVIRTAPSPYLVAKDRTGFVPDEIDLKEEGGYQFVKDAFEENLTAKSRESAGE